MESEISLVWIKSELTGVDLPIKLVPNISFLEFNELFPPNEDNFGDYGHFLLIEDNGNCFPYYAWGKTHRDFKAALEKKRGDIEYNYRPHQKTNRFEKFD